MLDETRLCFPGRRRDRARACHAALFMALAKSLARSPPLHGDRDLAAAVARINVELSQDNRQDMALTLLVGVLTPADGQIELVCAGHENPLVTRGDGQVRELQLLGGPPLCVDPSFPYPVETPAAPARRDSVLAFSDGLTEAQSRQLVSCGRARTCWRRWRPGRSRPDRRDHGGPGRRSGSRVRRPAPSPATTSPSSAVRLAGTP